MTEMPTEPFSIRISLDCDQSSLRATSAWDSPLASRNRRSSDRSRRRVVAGLLATGALAVEPLADIATP